MKIVITLWDRAAHFQCCPYEKRKERNHVHENHFVMAREQAITCFAGGYK